MTSRFDIPVIYEWVNSPYILFPTDQMSEMKNIGLKVNGSKKLTC